MEHMSDWPAKLPGDVAWVYVSIHSDNAGEAVTVVVNEGPDGPGIRSVEWGRP